MTNDQGVPADPAGALFHLCLAHIPHVEINQVQDATRARFKKMLLARILKTGITNRIRVCTTKR